jgi:tryptophan-rich sensory protein
MSAGDIGRLIFCILVCEAAGVIGSIFTVRSIPIWYKTLKKPPFTPPNRLFAPIWISLYLLMGITVFFIWRQLDSGVSGALLPFILFWVQLVFNILWSIVFFGIKSTSVGAVFITILWLLILVTIVTSFGVSAEAGWLLIPYILWVSIATYLNFGIWWLNRSYIKAGGTDG